MDRDNLQVTGLVAKIGWLAGIIDGEGSIVLLISERKGADARCNLRVQPRVIVGNTDQGIIDRMIEVLEHLGIGRYIKHDRPMPRDIPGFHPNKPVTTVYVEGFKRLKILLTVVAPHLAGEKQRRAEILLRYIRQRDARSEAAGKASNMSYTQEDVDTILEFLALTRSTNIERLTRLLNEHTREARQNKRKNLQREYSRAARSREYVRPSRRALVSHESVRDARNEHPPL